MSNSNVIKGVYESFANGDVPSVLAAFDENISWTEAEGFPYGGTYIGPNSVLESRRRAKTIVDEMLHVGVEQSACSWMNPSTSHWFQPSLMAVQAIAIAAAVANERPRNTFTGEACRSAIAPKINGETNAASAEVANAYGLMSCNPCASSTVLKGTNHIPNAAP